MIDNRWVGDHEGWTTGEYGLAAAGVVLTAAAVALAVANAPQDRWLPAAVLRGALVAAPVMVGLLALRRRASDRFAWLLVLTGLLFSLTALAESRAALPYSLGRTAVWLVEPVLAYLILSFPSGRLSGAADRAVVAAIVLVAGVLYLPTALLSEHFPEPSPFSTCETDCPHNALVIADATTFVDDVVRPLREVLTVLLFFAVCGLLIRRSRRGGGLLRQALAPVIAVAAFRAVAIAIYFPVRALSEVGLAVDFLGWAWAMALPAVALSFGAGLVARRLHAASALRHLAFTLRSRADLGEVRDAMAEALEDPSLRLVYRLPGAPGKWVDQTGATVGAPHGREGRTVTAIRGDDGSVVGAVVHDATLGQDVALVETAASYALVAVENASLLAQLRSSVRELADSRARIIDSTDAMRRGIERDLHDGGQQRLTALRVRIELTAERLDAVSPDGAARVRALGAEVDDAIDEIRRLARGIYPAILSDQGLAAALRAAARASPVPTVVEAGDLGGIRPELARTVYFACIEALQNAVKHARGVSVIAISVSSERGELRFEVADDGAGFDERESPGGSGLLGLVDRLAAVGGSVRVEARPDGGTRVVGSVPGL